MPQSAALNATRLRWPAGKEKGPVVKTTGPSLLLRRKAMSAACQKVRRPEGSSAKTVPKNGN